MIEWTRSVLQPGSVPLATPVCAAGGAGTAGATWLCWERSPPPPAATVAATSLPGCKGRWCCILRAGEQNAFSFLSGPQGYLV